MEILVNRYAALLAAAVALLAAPVHAKEGDTFRPFVSGAYFHDDNLFRLDKGEAPDLKRADRYGLLSAGVDVDWKHGRQQVLVNASKTLVRYDRYSYLDYDGDDLKAMWNWRLGNRFSGNLGASKSTSQSSFADIGLVNNQVDRERRFGRAEWEFHPRWRIGAGVETTDNTNSDPSLFSQDFNQDSYDILVTYRTPKGSTVRGRVRRIDSDFPTMKLLGLNPFPPLAAVADSSYAQTDYTLLADWRFSAKLVLRGEAGWVDRKYTNALKGSYAPYEPWMAPYEPLLVDRPDYSGFNGRLTADWYATGKTLLSLSGYQELGGATDINASSVLKRGTSVSGVWLIREKWRLNGEASYENRDFRGDMGAGTTQTEDDTVGASLSLNYTPIRPVSMDFGMRAGRRDSNISAGDYTFSSVFFSVRGDF
ncbi:MAG: hypothetical protein BGP21_04945 [Thiobacillus sp. 65-29]|nr:MAG: hypothetical protein BGP21_04945 [Thiobacillus sp. 65-29]